MAKGINDKVPEEKAKGPFPGMIRIELHKALNELPIAIADLQLVQSNFSEILAGIEDVEEYRRLEPLLNEIRQQVRNIEHLDLLLNNEIDALKWASLHKNS